MRWVLAVVMAAALAGCQSVRRPVVAPVPEPRTVVVADAAPSSAVVERTVARVEARVAETSSKVDEVSASVAGAVEAAIRADDAEQLAAMRGIQRQVDTLRVGLKLAEAESKAMGEELAALRGVVERVQAERDTAREEEAAAQARHDADKMAWEAERGQLRAETQRVAGQLEETRAGKAWWVRAALITWGVVVLGGVAVAIVKLRLI